MNNPLSLIEAMGVQKRHVHHSSKGKAYVEKEHPVRSRKSSPKSQLTQRLMKDPDRRRRALQSYVRVDESMRRRATEAEKEIAKLSGGEHIGNRAKLLFDVRGRDAKGRLWYIEVRSLQKQDRSRFWMHYEDGKLKDDKALREKARVFGVAVDLRDGRHDYYFYEATYEGERWVKIGGKRKFKKYGEPLKRRRWGMCAKDLDQMQKVTAKQLKVLFARVAAGRE